MAFSSAMLSRPFSTTYRIKLYFADDMSIHNKVLTPHTSSPIFGPYHDVAPLSSISKFQIFSFGTRRSLYFWEKPKDPSLFHASKMIWTRPSNFQGTTSMGGSSAGREEWEWVDLGIYDLFQLFKFSIHQDQPLLLAALSYWATSTNSFHFTFGPMTVIFLDMATMFDFPPMARRSMVCYQPRKVSVWNLAHLHMDPSFLIIVKPTAQSPRLSILPSHCIGYGDSFFALPWSALLVLTFD